MESLANSIERGNGKSFDQLIGNLTEILTNYYEEYHLELSDVLNQRLDIDCSTLLHKAAVSKRDKMTWYLPINYAPEKFRPFC